MRVQTLAGHRHPMVRGFLAVPASTRSGDTFTYAVSDRRRETSRTGHGLSARQEHNTQVSAFECHSMVVAFNGGDCHSMVRVCLRASATVCARNASTCVVFNRFVARHRLSARQELNAQVNVLLDVTQWLLHSMMETALTPLIRDGQALHQK